MNETHRKAGPDGGGGVDGTGPFGERVEVEERVAVKLHHEAQHQNADEVHQDSRPDLGGGGGGKEFLFL